MYETDENGTIYDPEKEVTGEQIANKLAQSKQSLYDIGKLALLTAAGGLLLCGVGKIQECFTNLPKLRQRQYQAAHFCLGRNDLQANELGMQELERLANGNIESFLAGDNLQERAKRALQEAKGEQK